MRKIKSTALLGAFVAVASVGVISHEAHGTTLTTGTTNVAKEILPSSVTLPAPVITSSVNYSSVSIVLTLSGASFGGSAAYSYTIVNAAVSSTCTGNVSANDQLNSLTFTAPSGDTCSLSLNDSYTISGGPSGASSNSIVLYVPSQNTSSIVLSYSSNVGNDTQSSVTLAQAMQQLSVSAYSLTQAVISPLSLTAFTNGFNSATNAVAISNSAYNNNTWSNTISAVSDTINFLFTGIPSSVTLVSATDTNSTAQSTSATPGNASATVSFTLKTSGYAPFQSGSSDTIYFGFSNTGSIQPGNIVLSSITGIAPISGASNYVYLSTPQPFINFQYSNVQIYVPDALAPDGNNGITSGYITISMPQGATISSISALNTSVTCTVSGLSLCNTHQ
jgi:hypothetical protein